MRRVVLWVLEWMQRCPTPSDEKYHRAMQVGGEVLQKMSDSNNDPTRQIVSDILSNRQNGPYVTTVYETLQEMNSPVKQGPS